MGLLLTGPTPSSFFLPGPRGAGLHLAYQFPNFWTFVSTFVRSFVGLLRSKFGPYNFIMGQRDKRIKRQKHKGTKGQREKETKGQRDKGKKGQRDSGQREKGTKGQR